MLLTTSKEVKERMPLLIFMALDSFKKQTTVPDITGIFKTSLSFSPGKSHYHPKESRLQQFFGSIPGSVKIMLQEAECKASFRRITPKILFNYIKSMLNSSLRDLNVQLEYKQIILHTPPKQLTAAILLPFLSSLLFSI